MIMHECSHVGCTELIPYNVRYCEKHRKQQSHKTMQSHKRNDEFFGFYQSTQWRKTSLLYRESNPLCEQCHRHLGSSVDHIKPLRLGGSPYDWNNLQTLCSSCHNKKTRQEQKYYKNR